MKLVYMRIPNRPSISCTLLASVTERTISAQLLRGGIHRTLLFSEYQQQWRSERFYLVAGTSLVLAHPHGEQTVIVWERGFHAPQSTGVLPLSLQELFN